MKKIKICVYAICKNEEKYINGWVDSMSEADKIFVLDTGSSDNSVELLKKRGVIVKKEKIDPWRFDVARNISLDMVDKDTTLCVCTDLDEVFDKGWREKLEKVYNDKITRIRYPYIWNFDDKGNPKTSFYIDNIHIREGYRWTHPVHEVLKKIDNKEVFTTCFDIVLNHHADPYKSRAMYLPLLELSVKEDSNDDRNMHYLGREYMFHRRYNDAIDTLIRHLSLKTAKWKDERGASMRYIARCYKELNRKDEAKMWLKKAIKEVPYTREAYTELGRFYYEEKKYSLAIRYLEKALSISYKSPSYINESFCWDGTIEDILSVCYYYDNDYKKALEYVDIVLKKYPDNKRIITNKIFICNKLKTLK